MTETPSVMLRRDAKNMRYFVSEIRDDTDLLRCELKGLGEGGGRIVSVIWQPPRRTFAEGKEIDRSSGYVIVSEYENNTPVE